MIVVVEDEPDLLAVMCAALHEEGYEVIGLGDPAALKHLTGMGDRPNLFLLDIMLPGTTGVEVAQRLRRVTPPDTPMIAMSASSSIVQEATQSGLFQEALLKPFDIDTLLDTVGRYLD